MQQKDSFSGYAVDDQCLKEMGLTYNVGRDTNLGARRGGLRRNAGLEQLGLL